MAVDDPWQPFKEIVDTPMQHARAWKEKSGCKIVGHLLPDVPDEIIHAAGALPVAIEGAGEGISHAQAHIPSYSCAHSMGTLEMALKGELDILDGMVIPYVCDTTRNLFHIWSIKFQGMKNEFLRLPKRLDFDGIRDYLSSEFSRLFDSMKELTGVSSGKEQLTNSLKLYNQSRQKLRQAYQLHKNNPTLWTAERVQILIGSALRAPREEHLQWMEALPWNERSKGEENERTPIYVHGKVWDPPEILGLFEELKFLTVGDDLVTGYRYIEKDAPIDGDPIDGLVERHMTTIPYTGYHFSPEKMVQRFVERVQVSGAKGVLFLNPKFCEAAAFDTPDFQKGLEAQNIPSLILETSTRGVSMGQIRIRLEALREMISGDLP